MVYGDYVFSSSQQKRYVFCLTTYLEVKMIHMTLQRGKLEEHVQGWYPLRNELWHQEDLKRDIHVSDHLRNDQNARRERRSLLAPLPQIKSSLAGRIAPFFGDHSACPVAHTLINTIPLWSVCSLGRRHCKRMRVISFFACRRTAEKVNMSLGTAGLSNFQ